MDTHVIINRFRERIIDSHCTSVQVHVVRESKVDIHKEKPSSCFRQNGKICMQYKNYPCITDLPGGSLQGNL